MSNKIRPAELDVDRRLITDLLSRNLSPNAGGPRFDWLYLQNPHGCARAWVVIEENTGKGIGAAAAFPRKLCVDGSTCLGYVLGDFCIDQQYRSLGLALQLQRACVQHVDSTSCALSYDFPSDRMMAIYRRMQIAPWDQMVRWSKPLRVDRKLGELVKSVRLVRNLAVPINKFLEWKDQRFVANCEWSIAEHKGDCDEEFTELAHAVRSDYGICVERSAQYLNWRYLRHPAVRHELLTARRGKALMGYVVFSQTGEDAKIVDLFGVRDATMWTALVAEVVARLHARGAIIVSAPALATNPWAGLLRKWGFHQRERSPIVIYASEKMNRPSKDPTFPWFLTDGDRES